MQSVLSSQILALTLERRAVSKQLQENRVSREYRKSKCRSDSL